MTPEEKKERDRLYYLKNKEKVKLRQKNIITIIKKKYLKIGKLKILMMNK